MTADDRFRLVSSLYGPGNLACWLLLLFSVIVSWTINPKSKAKDSITSDLIAAVALPVVACAHFFHQMYQENVVISSSDVRAFTTTSQWDNLQRVAAIEASLTVCENFICWSAILQCIAGHQQHKLRATIVTIVGWLSLSTELALLGFRSTFEDGLFVRPFLFHCEPLFCALISMAAITIVVYLAELLSSSVSLCAPTTTSGVDRETYDRGRMIRLGRLGSWCAACTGVVTTSSVFYMKYAYASDRLWLSPIRFVAKSNISMKDLDQVVTVAGGAIALAFSIYDAIKERRKRTVIH